MVIDVYMSKALRIAIVLMVVCTTLAIVTAAASAAIRRKPGRSHSQSDRSAAWAEARSHSQSDRSAAEADRSHNP